MLLFRDGDTLRLPDVEFQLHECVLGSVFEYYESDDAASEVMSRHWKVPYTVEAAEAPGIHDFEDTKILGDPKSQWIYYVRVCGFTFGFFSLEMVEEYLRFYSQKLAPSTLGHAAAYQGGGQTRFDRLPPRLRRSGKREQVVAALYRALVDFKRSS